MALAGRRLWPPLHLLLLVLIVAGLEAQAPPLSIRVGSPGEGWPAIVEVGPLLDDSALRSALESALPLRFHLRVELWRKGTFDRLDQLDERSAALMQDPVSGSYTIESPGRSHRVHTLPAAADALAMLLNTELRPNRGGRYYYLATLEVETLSLSDLDELRRWLRGEVAPAVEGRRPPLRALERGLQRLMVRVIGLPTRRFEARSADFELR